MLKQKVGNDLFSVGLYVLASQAFMRQRPPELEQLIFGLVESTANDPIPVFTEMRQHKFTDLHIECRNLKVIVNHILKDTT